MGKAEFAAFLAYRHARLRKRKMRTPIVAVRTSCAHADDHDRQYIAPYSEKQVVS